MFLTLASEETQNYLSVVPSLLKVISNSAALIKNHIIMYCFRRVNVTHAKCNFQYIFYLSMFHCSFLSW